MATRPSPPRATNAKDARAKPIVDVLPPDLPREVELRVRREGALPLTKLTSTKLGPSARAELEAALVARGLERTAKHVRVPLAHQIEALVAGGARVPLKDVPKRLKGGDAKSSSAALHSAVRDGRVRMVVRTSVEVLVGPGDPALGDGDLGALAAAHAALGKVLKKVAAKGYPRSILREDLAPLLEPFARLAGRGGDARGARAAVLDALRRLEDPVLKLARIPAVVRAVEGRVALADVHRALLQAAEVGEIELRPDAGAEFLADEDARLCPPGPRGSVFSYAALLAPKGAT